MKRMCSYWVAPFQFSDATRAEVGRRLKDNADKFLSMVAEPCGCYLHDVKATVLRGTVNRWRQAIERIGRDANTVADTLRSLEPDCARLLDMGFVTQTHRLDSREMALAALDDLVGACTRAAADRGLRPGEGTPPDYDRRRLGLACAEAFRCATGKEPKASPNGTFARVLLAIEKAVGATPRTQTSISDAYLKPLLARKTRKVTPHVRR